MSDGGDSGGAIEDNIRRPKLWFAERDVPVLMYRINRRPSGNPQLFDSPLPSFIDHMERCLLFGQRFTTGRRYKRQWALGNRRIVPSLDWIAGFIGYESEGLREADHYDDERKEWIEDTEQDQRAARAPFVVRAEDRLLYVFKHPKFSPTTIPRVFEMILQEGEREFSGRTEWSVEPMLDERGFNEWLDSVALLELVRFKVKLPNPDAEDAFQEIDQHLRNTRAGKLIHQLEARDSQVGLNKDLQHDRLSSGFLAMSVRSFAQLFARGRDGRGRRAEYRQEERVQKRVIPGPDTYEGALDSVITLATTDAEAADG